MNRYKLKVRNNIGDILKCEFCTELAVWEFCKMYEIQCDCEILKLEKIEPLEVFSYLESPIPKKLNYNYAY